MKNQELENRKQIKAFCNFLGYSDVTPYEVVRKISDQTVEIRLMDYKLIKSPTFHAGGFSAHAENYEQKWEITSNLDNPISRIRFSKRLNSWAFGNQKFSMSDQPVRFYDYNF